MATSGGTAAADLVAQAQARLVADKSFQFSLGMFHPPPPPSWLVVLARLVGKTLRAIFPVVRASWPVLRVGVWIALAAGVLAILVMILRAAWRRSPKARPAPAAPAPAASLRPSARRARALLEDADRLAAEGRFSEAAHVLLFRTIDDLEARPSLGLRPALTSRDIAALADMPAPAQRAFAAIAAHVERSFFGGRVLSAEDFSACRAAFAAFASPESWVAGATA